MRKKILIIKLGYSETLDEEIGRVSSLGDVLRTTPILPALKERFTDAHITWLVDTHALPLLKNNPLIDRILLWDEFVPFQLMRERFDMLINLEKVAGICALSDMIDAWVKYGFRFDSETGMYHAYEKGLDFLTYIKNKRKEVNNKKFWQQVLVEMIGITWSAQEYIIGYQPKSEPNKFDVGLNYEVGHKWPTKAMPIHLWQDVAQKIIDKGITVSWQEGKDNLFDYMNWLNSCKVVISNDSLGLHIALALKKNVIGLFGPTDNNEVFFYNRGKAITSDTQCEQMPCFDAHCKTGLNCMNGINIDKILQEVEFFLKEPYSDR